MSTIKKSFVINNNLANLTKGHMIQLFKPSYNPKYDDASYVSTLSTPIPATTSFPLQEYQVEPSGTNPNPVVGPYCSNKGTTDAVNIVTNLFLVTENFLNFITKINNFWYSDILPREVTPVTYTPNVSTGALVATADTTFVTQILSFFAGPSANNASAGFAAYETLAKLGIEGSTLNDGVGSCSIHELFLRHLYSTDSRKRDIAFAFAQTFYGIAASEIASARLEMIPAVDFDSDLFDVNMTDDVIKLQYNKPIKLQTKYNETVHNIGNKSLYLYFPYITSNASRANSEANRDYQKYINMYTGLSNPTINLATPTSATTFKKSFVYRAKSTTGVGLLTKTFCENMPTLTNTIWSVSKEKAVNQAGYTALKISEVGGGGDLQFDHTDKIDYIDSLTIEIKVPTVFS